MFFSSAIATNVKFPLLCHPYHQKYCTRGDTLLLNVGDIYFSAWEGKTQTSELNWNLCGPVKYGNCLIKKEEKDNFSVFETIIVTSVSLLKKTHNKNYQILRIDFHYYSTLLKHFIKLNCCLLLGVKLIKTVTVLIV